MPEPFEIDLGEAVLVGDYEGSTMHMRLKPEYAAVMSREERRALQRRLYKLALKSTEGMPFTIQKGWVIQ